MGLRVIPANGVFVSEDSVAIVKELTI